MTTITRKNYDSIFGEFVQIVQRWREDVFLQFNSGIGEINISYIGPFENLLDTMLE